MATNRNRAEQLRRRLDSIRSGAILGVPKGDKNSIVRQIRKGVYYGDNSEEAARRMREAQQGRMDIGGNKNATIAGFAYRTRDKIGFGGQTMDAGTRKKMQGHYYRENRRANGLSVG